MNIPLPILCESQRNEKTVETQTLIDSGAGGDFLHQDFATKHRINLLPLDLLPLDTLIIPQNIDGTLNIREKITHYIYADILFDDWRIGTKLLVTNIEKNNLILGLPWLKENNPQIDWKTGRMELTELTHKEQIVAAMRKDRERWAKKALKKEQPLKKTNEETLIAILTTMEQEQKTNKEELWINIKTRVAPELAQKEAEKQKTKTLKEMILSELMDYHDVFNKKKAEWFPEPQPWDHAIDLKPDFVPKDCKVYPLTPQEHVEMDKFINENLAKGYIQPSKYPMASPFFFVAKKSRDLQPCQDYWWLNEGTIKNSYPLPLISDLVDQLKGAKYFTKLDVRWGYNDVRIKDGDQWKVAFKTSRGLFKPTVMFFRMCNSPATFQAMMDDVFWDMKAKGWIIIYMDDIFIFTKELQWNIKYTKRTLQWLQDNDLYLKPEKCTFWMMKVEHLGLVIQDNLISMDPVKLNGIKDWLTPTTVKQVQSFLGFGNYYRRFIYGYGNLTRPLNDLKPVHLKVKPVIRALLDKFRIVRNIIGNPSKIYWLFQPTLQNSNLQDITHKKEKTNLMKHIPAFYGLLSNICYTTLWWYTMTLSLGKI